MENIVQQDNINAPFRNIRKIAPENHPNVLESPLIRSSLNRFHGKWMDVHRIYKALRGDQPGRREGKAAWATAKVENYHAGVYSCFLQYIEGWTPPVSDSEPH